MAKSKTATAARKAAGQAQKSEPLKHSDGSGKAARETIESIAVAVILAFLFRAFVAEAFVMPTGSMAPTLQGRHMDVECEKCGCPYRTGASQENDGSAQVIATTCPICRYTMELDKVSNANQRSFNGDRILVSKFAYEVGNPKRWDVVAFRPDAEKTELRVLRVVGLPGEDIRFEAGGIVADDQPIEIPEALKSISYAPGAYQVPEEHYLLLNDVPGRLNDSRRFGAIHRELIVSRIDRVKNDK